MSTSEPNWVQKRAQCTVETLFDALRQRLTADMAEVYSPGWVYQGSRKGTTDARLRNKPNCDCSYA